MSSRSENDIYFLHSYSTACSSLANKYLRNVDQETWIESKFEEKRIFFRSVFILSFLYFQVFVYAYLKYSLCFPIAWQTQKKQIEFNSIELIRLRASIWHNSPNTYARASVEFIAFPEHCFFLFWIRSHCISSPFTMWLVPVDFVLNLMHFCDCILSVAIRVTCLLSQSLAKVAF